MATSRAPCQSCSLPFYTDENDLCPYCGQAVPDGGTTDTPSARSRTTCDSCGLAYYEGEHDDCPYCAQASHPAETDEAAETHAEEVEAVEETASVEESEPDSDVAGAAGDAPDAAEVQPEPTADDREEDERSSSLLGSLRRLLGR